MVKNQVAKKVKKILIKDQQVEVQKFHLYSKRLAVNPDLNLIV